MSWTIELPAGGMFGWPPSPNDRTGWRVRARQTAGWRAAVYGAVHLAEIPHQSRIEASVTWRTTRGRPNDHDNLVARCKPLYDGLVGCWFGSGAARVLLPGIIDDDDAAHLVHGPVLEERIPGSAGAIILTISAA